MKSKDFEMYYDSHSGQVVLEFFDQKDGNKVSIGKMYFSSYDSARFYILKNLY